uniref:Methionine aminopeptidase n=1 Tax=Candidatus Aschnera chinzeii TaxID=1485666 RepID=A0AAT9G414_9ENTR|nr:MAG: type I methionyl aminopeptidase [Candidatus Aschnera chinzeii]
MLISIKKLNDIKNMRIAGNLAAKVLEFIEPYITQGISTGEIDRICHDYIINKQKAIPACLHYNGFPKSICTSINDVVCHGIPNDKQILNYGDIINIDVTVIKNGFYGDTSKMFIVGTTNVQNEFLCKITQQSLYLALKVIKPNLPIRKIGQTIQLYVEKHNFSIVREYCGHGIGTVFHEEPQILHYDADDHGIRLKKGMTFTIEPMVNIGKRDIKLMNDGWTVKTKDKSYSAQYEHTILVTENGCEVLTLREEEIPMINKILVNS